MVVRSPKYICTRVARDLLREEMANVSEVRTQCLSPPAGWPAVARHARRRSCAVCPAPRPLSRPRLGVQRRRGRPRPTPSDDDATTTGRRWTLNHHTARTHHLLLRLEELDRVLLGGLVGKPLAGNPARAVGVGHDEQAPRVGGAASPIRQRKAWHLEQRKTSPVRSALGRSEKGARANSRARVSRRVVVSLLVYVAY